MTIEQKAWEIVASQYPEMRPSYKGRRLTIARLGIIEGLEMAAKVAERRLQAAQNAQDVALAADVGSPSYGRGCIVTADFITTAIRALIEEQKV